MSNPDISLDAVAIAIVGSGGAGAITAGGLLLEAASAAGWYGLMTRSVGPQIRGGEALAMVRLAPAPVVAHGDYFDVLLALDWHNADRFIDEVPLNEHGLILADAYDAEILRMGPETPLPGARRKVMVQKFARHAASRLQAYRDPGVAALVTP